MQQRAKGQRMKTKRERDNSGTEGEVKLHRSNFGVLIDILENYHLGRIQSLNKMCHTDVVWGGSVGRMERRSNKEVLSVKVLAPAWPFSPRVVLAVFIVPSQSTEVYLERKLEAFSVHHHD